jgi:hypothetical protein
VLAIAACSGSDKKPAPGTSGKTASPAPASSSSSATESSTGPELKILVAEPLPGTFTFDTYGAQSVSGGAVAVTITNSTTSAHEARLIRIRDNDFNAFKSAVLAQGGAVATSLGDVAFASTTVGPGETASATAALTAGTYALVDFLTAPDGKTFAEHGMITRIDVVAGALPTGSAGSESSASSAASGSGASSSSGSSASQSSSSSSSSGTPGSSSGSTSSSSP